MEENMGMSTDVIIGHFLKAEDDISTIIDSEKFIDTVVDSGDGYYFSNDGNTVFHWSKGVSYPSPVDLMNDKIEKMRQLFEVEICEITDLLDLLGIKYQIIYGAKTYYS